MRTVIRGGTVVTGDGRTVLEGAAVIVSDGRIEGVEARWDDAHEAVVIAVQSS